LLFLCLVAAFCLRIVVAATQPYLWDEEHNAIPLANSISFSSSHPNLPIRGQHHPALPSYIVKASSALFGHSPLGYRALHVVAGLIGILLIWHLTRLASGDQAALWAAALLAFNEYDVGVSSFATAKGPHLIFMIGSIYAFGRFLLTPRAAWLYAAAAAVGLAFYAKEHALLALPVFAGVLLQSKYRHWFRSPHLYGSLAVVVIVIAPDVLWNLAKPDPEQAGYGDQFSRIGGLGLNGYPFLFFAHHAIRWVYEAVTGSVLADGVAENPSMNVVLGPLLFGLVVASTFRKKGFSTLRPFLLSLFWFVFIFFVSLRPGRPTLELDPVAWYWTDVVLFPAVILSGSRLANTTGRWGIVLKVLAVIGMVTAVVRTAFWWPFVDEDLAP